MSLVLQQKPIIVKNLLNEEAVEAVDIDNRPVVIISNRLPVTVVRDDDGGGLSLTSSVGGLATGLRSVYQLEQNLWFGWPGICDLSEQEEAFVSEELEKDNMRPVFLTSEDMEAFYEGFSNDTLWPLHHYFTEYVNYDRATWDAYQRVNRLFAERVLLSPDVDTESAIFWVHDYQLMLLPALLRDTLPAATIGFFNHIPFPTYEIFRQLPWRDEVLEGILGADLVGFHTYDDSRHFLSSVNRALGCKNRMGIVIHRDRMVAVDAFPMGIDYDKFAAAHRNAETEQAYAQHKDLLRDIKVILSVDRLDYSKGIGQRLEAFDAFLEQNAEFHGKVALLLVVVPCRENVELYKTMKAEIDTTVGKITGKYGTLEWTPVLYFYRTYDFNSLTALYALSDVCLVTPLRDGMNLVAKEYIACKKHDSPGVLVLSEMAGAAKELSEAIVVNPNNKQQMVDAIHLALTMPDEEKEQRLSHMQHRLKRLTVFRWVSMFMHELQEIKYKQAAAELQLLNSTNRATLLQEYNQANKRIMFLDYDGTLKPFGQDPKKVFPDDELTTTLRHLTEDPRNTIVIISGRDKPNLEDWFKTLKVDIVAEHGVWYRQGDGEFQMIEDLNTDWREKIASIMERQVDRTPRSFVELKEYSVAWHYRKSDVDFGEVRARELLKDLTYLVTTTPGVHIMQGDKVVEVKCSEINKGKAAKRWVNGDEYDFIMACGDDVTDEDTFDAMPASAFTIKVGLRTTKARFNVRDSHDIRKLLRLLASEPVSQIVSDMGMGQERAAPAQNNASLLLNQSPKEPSEG